MKNSEEKECTFVKRMKILFGTSIQKAMCSACRSELWPWSVLDTAPSFSGSCLRDPVWVLLAKGENEGSANRTSLGLSQYLTNSSDHIAVLTEVV